MKLDIAEDGGGDGDDETAYCMFCGSEAAADTYLRDGIEWRTRVDCDCGEVYHAEVQRPGGVASE